MKLFEQLHPRSKDRQDIPREDPTMEGELEVLEVMVEHRWSSRFVQWTPENAADTRGACLTCAHNPDSVHAVATDIVT